MSKAKNKLLIYIITALLFICSAYFLRTSFYYLAASVTNSLQDISFFLPIVLIGFIFVFYVILFLKHYYIANISRKRLIIYSSILLLLTALSSIFFFISFGDYLSNFVNGVDEYKIIIFYTLALIILLILGVFSLIISLKKYAIIKNDTYLFSSFSKCKTALIIVFMILSLYMLYCIYLSFIVYENASRSLSGFILLVLYFCLIIYDFIFIFLDEKYKNKLMRIITFSFNLFLIIYFIILETQQPNFMVLVSKPYAPIDFAMSFPVLSYIFFVSLFYICGYIVYEFIKDRNLKKQLISKKDFKNK